MPTKRNLDLMDLRHPSDKKASKPLMEKRRRARINHSLAQLKALVIDPNTTERSRQTKLEKADILELTVRHLHEIKRQQRTVLLLESRHPKKRFEIGYSECVREVELFLSNLISPQSSSLDIELQKRLTDHLVKRLQDFTNIEPLDVTSVKESSDEELNADEPSSSSSSNGAENLPICLGSEETDSSDSSALNQMLKCYSEDKKPFEMKDDDLSSARTLSSKRFKTIQSVSNDDDLRFNFSSPSVTSTTGGRSSGTPFELSKSENYSENVHAKTMSSTVKDCVVSETKNTQNIPQIYSTKPECSSSKSRPYLPTCSQQSKKEIVDYKKHISNGEDSVAGKGKSLPSSSSKKFIEKIPLVPRQLANGDWALVLPASLVPVEKEESHPFSAFRLVVPASSGAADLDCDQMKQRFHSTSSPLSSTVSDLSLEEFCERSDGDPVERMDHNSPDSTQVVWRPW